MNLHIAEVVLPLRAALTTAYGTLSERRVVLVGVEEGPDIGWGEAAPYPGADAEDVDDVWTALTGGMRLPPTAEAALSAAMIDLSARRAGQTLADEIGAAGDAPIPSLAIGAAGLDEMLNEVESAVNLGCGAVKLKVGPDDAGRVAAVARRFPGLTIGADANGSLADLGSALAFEQSGAAYLEQPFEPSDLERHARLRDRATVMEVVLDESLRGADDAERILEAGAADRICLKPGRLGIAGTLRIADRAIGGGVGIKVGGMFDSAVGRAIAAAVARLPGSRYDDVAPDGAYFTDDIGAADPGLPGIGFDPDVDRLAVRRTRVPLPDGRGTVPA